MNNTPLPKVFGIPLATTEGMPAQPGGVYPLPNEAPAADPKKKTGCYVDESGAELTVEIIATHRDGKRDILIPDDFSGIRKDGVWLKGEKPADADPDPSQTPARKSLSS